LISIVMRISVEQSQLSNVEVRFFEHRPPRRPAGRAIDAMCRTADTHDDEWVRLFRRPVLGRVCKLKSG
jgi:hypothetical protein